MRGTSTEQAPFPDQFLHISASIDEDLDSRLKTFEARQELAIRHVEQELQRLQGSVEVLTQNVRDSVQIQADNRFWQEMMERGHTTSTSSCDGVVDAAPPPTPINADTDLGEFAEFARHVSVEIQVNDLEGRVVQLEAKQLTYDVLAAELQKYGVYDSSAHNSKLRNSDIQTSLVFDTESMKLQNTVAEQGTDREALYASAESDIRHKVSRQKTKLSILSGQLGEVLTPPVRKLHENAWEAALFIGMPGFTMSINLTCLFVVALNVVTQSAFCAIIGSANAKFTTSTILTEDSLRSWRSMAHELSEVDPVSGVSLVARVCNQDKSLQVGGEQTTLVSDAKKYLGGLPFFLKHFRTGPTLFACSWLLWFFHVTRECAYILTFVLSLCTLLGSTTEVVFKDGACKLQSLSCSRFVFIVILTGMRFGVCAALFYCGSLWLATTIDVEDLLLNASALGFILDMDEMLYITLPSLLQNFCQAVDPIPLPSFSRSPRFGHFQNNYGMHPVIIIGSGLGFLIWLLTKQIMENVRVLENAQSIMCGGSLDFAWNEGPETGMLLASSTVHYRGSASKKQKIVRMAEQLWKRNLHNLVALQDNLSLTAYFLSNREFFDFYVERSLESITYNPGGPSPNCDSASVVDFSQMPRFFLEALLSQTGATGATGCSDLMSHCGKSRAPMLRWQCPTQCGCANASSGLYLSGASMGCPRAVCQRSTPYIESLSVIDCNIEKNSSQLNASSGSGWVRFWNDFGAWNPSSLDTTPQRARQLGCKILEDDAIMHSQFCFETPEAGSVAPFCPITCGCRRNPDRPDCTPQCRRFKLTFHSETQKLPCCDIDLASVNSSMWDAWKHAALHYFEKFPRHQLSKHLANVTPNISRFWHDVQILGCAQHSSFCSSHVGPYDLTPICPETCGCTLNKKSMCPGTCGTSANIC